MVELVVVELVVELVAVEFVVVETVVVELVVVVIGIAADILEFDADVKVEIDVRGLFNTGVVSYD